MDILGSQRLNWAFPYDVHRLAACANRLRDREHYAASAAHDRIKLSEEGLADLGVVVLRDDDGQGVHFEELEAHSESPAVSAFKVEILDAHKVRRKALAQERLFRQYALFLSGGEGKDEDGLDIDVREGVAGMVDLTIEDFMFFDVGGMLA